MAEALAERLGARLMAVDSMQVYRGMDIGTAKPDAEARGRHEYLMLDVADPWEAYSAAKFVAEARGYLADGKPVVLVAGTILYLRALLEGLFEGPSANEEIRARLEAEAAAGSVQALHGRLVGIDPDLAQQDLAGPARGVTARRDQGGEAASERRTRRASAQWTPAVL